MFGVKGDSVFLQVAKNCSGSYLPEVPVSAFGQNVKRIRLAKRPKLKAKELAERLETDPSVISRWEKGKGGLPETPTMMRLAKTLAVSVEALIAGVDADYDRIRARADSAQQKNSDGVTSPDSGDRVQGSPTPTELVARVTAEGDRLDPDSSRLPAPDFGELHTFVSIVRPIIEHARRIAELSARLPPTDSGPAAAGGDADGHAPGDPDVRRTGGGGRRNRR